MDIPKPQKGSVFINESFFSIQGEGIYTGKPAFFIRFAGCDIGCKWCDSKDAWNPNHAKLIKIDDLLNDEALQKSEMVVITGGEPLVHDLEELTQALHEAGKKIHIETSGAYALAQTKFDWLCVSPKVLLPARKDVLSRAHELKVVVSDASDFDRALDFQNAVNDQCCLLLQPQWEQNKKMIPAILEFLKTHSDWRLSVQLHKFINLP